METYTQIIHLIHQHIKYILMHDVYIRMNQLSAVKNHQHTITEIRVLQYMGSDENNLCASSSRHASLLHVIRVWVLCVCLLIQYVCEHISDWYMATTKLLNPRKTCRNAVVQAWWNKHRFAMNRAQVEHSTSAIEHTAVIYIELFVVDDLLFSAETWHSGSDGLSSIWCTFFNNTQQHDHLRPTHINGIYMYWLVSIHYFFSGSLISNSFCERYHETND